MIRFSHEANSWMVLDQYCDPIISWERCSPYYAKQMVDIGYIVLID